MRVATPGDTTLPSGYRYEEQREKNTQGSYSGGNPHGDGSTRSVTYDPGYKDETEEKVNTIRPRGYQGPVEYDPKEIISGFVTYDRFSEIDKITHYYSLRSKLKLNEMKKTYADFFDESNKIDQVSEIGVGILIGDLGRIKIPHAGNSYNVLCILDLETCENYIGDPFFNKVILHSIEKVVKLGKNDKGEIIKIYIPDSLISSRKEWPLSAIARVVYDNIKVDNGSGIPKLNKCHEIFENFTLIKTDAKLQSLESTEHEKLCQKICDLVGEVDGATYLYRQNRLNAIPVPRTNMPFHGDTKQRNKKKNSSCTII